MLCRCGNTIKDNMPYCPYCGRKNHFMTSAPDSTMGTAGAFSHDSFKGYFPDTTQTPTENIGCARKLIRVVLGLLLIVAMLYLVAILLPDHWAYLMRDLGVAT